jgi:hypothetical protein
VTASDLVLRCKKSLRRADVEEAWPSEESKRRRNCGSGAAYNGTSQRKRCLSQCHDLILKNHDIIVADPALGARAFDIDLAKEFFVCDLLTFGPSMSLAEYERLSQIKFMSLLSAMPSFRTTVRCMAACLCVEQYKLFTYHEFSLHFFFFLFFLKFRFSLKKGQGRRF